MLDGLAILVVVLFGAVHLIEVSGFMARAAGVSIGRRAGAYALQNAVNMTTRFFQMALLPALGLLVDLGQTQRAYLLMVLAALAAATLASLLVVMARGRLKALFADTLERNAAGQNLLPLLLSAPLRVWRTAPMARDPLNLRSAMSNRLFWLSATVFAIYAGSMFLVFYGALLFPDYRASISHLSGLTNAFAALILTFVVEPRISHQIDQEGAPDAAIGLLMQLVAGRIFGVALFASLPFLAFLVIQPL